ncbi:CoF synthetase [Vibrio coralliilyticus]|uniref:phenylacetate--CoA ligase family protein n=1 Tax=Vibrio coralliilyticus TaxID=190893 RepID=UPI000BAA9FAC|nr:phenylacetate--CoA ligase family protein [Vibrio coralliilyticus]PAU36410.1 CoF synthetase [Vibrio coralliilyticus]
MNKLQTQIEHDWLRRVNRFLEGQTTLEEVFQEAQSLVELIKQYAQTKSPFYSSHLERTVGSSSSWKGLDKLPFTTKNDLRNVGVEVCSMPFDKVAVYYETTGTTGKPTPCPRAAIDIDTSGAYVKYAMQNIYESNFGNTEAMTAIMGPSELYAFGDTYGEVCRQLGIPYVRLWPESPRVGLNKALQLICDLDVKVLICSPAVALAIARLYLSNGLDPRDSVVEQILVLGELCTKEMLESISFIWGANCTHGLYGSQEAHAVATGCPNGNLHISETNYSTELIPIDNLSVNMGELCLTMLVPGAKPLIRYRTGDVVSFMAKSECSCGHPGRVLKVHGRVDDILHIDGKVVPPSEIESQVLGSIDGILNYQIELRVKDSGMEWANVLLVLSHKHYDLETVRSQLQNSLGIEIKLTILDELDPATETGAYVSWKHARIRDLRGTRNA